MLSTADLDRVAPPSAPTEVSTLGLEGGGSATLLAHELPTVRVRVRVRVRVKVRVRVRVRVRFRVKVRVRVRVSVSVKGLG